jgi:hypothetical protein
MQRATVAAGLFGLLTQNVAPSSPDIEVAPLFWAGQDQPAFVVQCHNTSGISRGRMEYIRKSSAFRLDGELHEKQVFVGSFIGPPGVPDGDTFSQLVVLGESPRAPIHFAGTWVMTPWGLSLKAGQHTIAFRCWSHWSAVHRFVWGGP